jgi:hypothetical protein
MLRAPVVELSFVPLPIYGLRKREFHNFRSRKQSRVCGSASRIPKRESSAAFPEMA